MGCSSAQTATGIFWRKSDRLNAAGSQRLANTFNGISIRTADANVVGGSAPGSRNVISGNGYYGLQIAEGSRSNLVAGNFIGTAASGNQALSNNLSGIRVESAGNIIGGSSDGEGNVICGNGLDGIHFVGPLANGNVVYGNSIGLNVLGSPLGNRRAGVGLSAAPGNEIGGAEAGQGNVISGNGDAGVYIVGAGASGNRLRANRIGTDRLGTSAQQNYYEGLLLQGASSNVIGGPLLGEGNLISGNRTRGVYLTNSSWNLFQGNSVGVSAAGTTGLPNGFHGVELEVGCHGNMIGGGEGRNRIGFSPDIYAGVRIRDGSLRNTILNNAIFNTGGLGIDLSEYGVAPNDSCDTDSGANMLQNFPVLSRAEVAGGQVSLRGELNSTQNQRFTLQFFATDVPGAFGHGFAHHYLGQASITAGTGCLASFSAILPLVDGLPRYVSATATDESGNTSEFSAAIPVTPLGFGLTRSAEGDLSLRWASEPASLVLFETDSLTAPVAWQVARTRVNHGQSAGCYTQAGRDEVLPAWVPVNEAVQPFTVVSRQPGLGLVRPCSVSVVFAQPSLQPILANGPDSNRVTFVFYPKGIELPTGRLSHRLHNAMHALLSRAPFSDYPNHFKLTPSRWLRPIPGQTTRPPVCFGTLISTAPTTQMSA
jgi:hypothetical protein